MLGHVSARTVSETFHKLSTHSWEKGANVRPREREKKE